MTPSRIDRLLDQNAAAVRELRTVVDSIDDASWVAPLRGTEGWTRGQHVVHLALAYAGVVDDICNRRHARPIGRRWQRRIWRIVGLSQIMWMKRLPPGVGAPREIRPPAGTPNRSTVLRDLDASVADFNATMRNAWTHDPQHQLLHPYFGPISLRQTIVLCAVHARHHAGLLRRSMTRAPAAGAAVPAPVQRR